MVSNEIVPHLMKMAAGEATASCVGAVTPVHLLVALSRMSEEEMSLGNQDLQLEFDSLGVEPRKFRRRLRGLIALRKENKARANVGPSESMKSAVALAQALARDDHDTTFLVHLLRAIFLPVADIGFEARKVTADEIPHEL